MPGIRTPEVIDVPEFDFWSVHENVREWQIGRRVVVWRPKVSLVGLWSGLGWGCSLMILFGILAIPLAVLALGAVISMINGRWDDFDNSVIPATFILLIVVAVLRVCLVPLLKGGGERETVIDWDAGTFSHRYRWRSRVHPVQNVQMLRVIGRESSGTSPNSVASLEAQINGESCLIFESREHQERALATCAKFATVARRLAESLSVPYEFIIDNRPVDREEVLRLDRSTKDVARKYVALANTVSGLLMFAEYRGQADEAERHRAEAIFYFMQAHVLDPDLLEPLLKIGRLSGDPTIRRQAVDTALHLNPESSDALLELADLMTTDDKLDEALRLCTRAIEQDPSVKAYHARAHAHIRLEQYRQAIADFTAAVNLEPENDFCYSQRAYCLMYWYAAIEQPSLLDKALADYDVAIRISPDNDSYQTKRSHVLRTAGRSDDAVAELSRIIDANPTSFHPLTQRGQIYLASGRAAEAALDDFSKALSLLEADPSPSNHALRQTQAECIAAALSYRAEALRQQGRLDEADLDEQRAADLLAQ